MNQQHRFTKSQPNTAIIEHGFGKVPPQALEFEEAVLGSCILDKTALGEVADILKPEMFYRETHQHIYSAIITLYDASEPVDELSLMQQLRKTGKFELIGGFLAITEITKKVVYTANSVYHARIIVQKFLSRCLIMFAQDILREAYEDTTDVFELIDSAQLSIDRIQAQLIKRPVRSGSQVLVETYKQAESAMNSKVGLTGVNTGITHLNDLYGGWQKTDLIILAGRPGMGKSAIAMNYVRSALVADVPVGVFSMEMSEVQLMNRMLSIEAYHAFNAIIPYEDIKKGHLPPDQWKLIHQAGNIYANELLQIDETPGLSISGLRSRAITMVTRHKVGLLVVDYLQLMEGDKRGNREQEIASIARALKNLAKELNVPIIALSQLSRAVETRGGDRRPQISDLRESGEIEQAADIIQFAYRPYYYGITQDDGGNSTENVCEILTRKNRNGESPVDTLVKFLPNVSAICDWSHVAKTLTVNNSVFKKVVSNNFYERERVEEPPF